jgi:hypothetical protein
MSLKIRNFYELALKILHKSYLNGDWLSIARLITLERLLSNLYKKVGAPPDAPPAPRGGQPPLARERCAAYVASVAQTGEESTKAGSADELPGWSSFDDFLCAYRRALLESIAALIECIEEIEAAECPAPLPNRNRGKGIDD